MVAASPMGRSDEDPAATLQALAAVLPSASCHVAGLHPTSFRWTMAATCVCAGLNSTVRDLPEILPKQAAHGYKKPDVQRCQLSLAVKSLRHNLDC